MTIRMTAFALVLGAGYAALVATAPAQALTAQECSAKYQAAKAAGTLGDQKWNDFRKAQCGADAAATPAAAGTTVAQAKSEAKPEAKSDTKSEPKAAKKDAKSDAAKAAKSAAAPALPAGPAVFPSAVSPKYAKEKEAKQRMQTCLDQYNANKASNGNGGLKWIQKGGGYYSECNKKLKG